MSTTYGPNPRTGLGAVLRGLSMPAAAALVLLGVLTAVSVVVALCAGLVAELAQRLAVAGMVAAAAVRDNDHHDAQDDGQPGPGGVPR